MGLLLVKLLVAKFPNWVLAIVSGALLAVTIPLSYKSKRDLKQGISQYNARNNSSFLNDFRQDVSLIGNASGLGLRLRF